MKTPLLLSALCCFLLFSCQTENLEELENVNADLTIDETNPFQYGPGGIPNSSGPNCYPYDATLEHRMAWTAYFTGLVLYEDSAIRDELLNIIDENSKTVTLTQLLGPGTESTLFHIEFDKYIDELIGNEITSLGAGCPDIPVGGPGEPIVDGGSFCGNCDPVTIFMDDILLKNCIELYFPRGINADPLVDIVTLAHPLCDWYANEGVSRVSCGSADNVSAVSPNYIQGHDYIYIVARPYDDASNNSCDYSVAHPSLDFDGFLAGSWPFQN